MLFGLIPGIGPQEFIIVAIIGVLLFGKRLPEVGRSLGKGIVEFKKGISGIEDELRSASYELDRKPAAPATPSYDPARDPYFNAGYETEVPKFEPPTAVASSTAPAAADAATPADPAKA